MKRLLYNQSGMTFIGIILFLAVIGCFTIFGYRLFPIYYEHLVIKTIMKSAIDHSTKSRVTGKSLRESFVKNARTNNINIFNERNIADYMHLKRSMDGKLVLYMKYENSSRLFKNIYLVVKTDLTMPVPEG